MKLYLLGSTRAEIRLMLNESVYGVGRAFTYMMPMGSSYSAKYRRREIHRRHEEARDRMNKELDERTGPVVPDEPKQEDHDDVVCDPPDITQCDEPATMSEPGDRRKKALQQAEGVSAHIRDKKLITGPGIWLDRTDEPLIRHRSKDGWQIRDEDGFAYRNLTTEELENLPRRVIEELEVLGYRRRERIAGLVTRIEDGDDFIEILKGMMK